MKLTPIDIKKHGFKKATFGGYETVEVDAFLETVSRYWEEELADAEKLKRRISELEGEMKKYREVESMLHQTLAQAQQSSGAVVENAKREAELIKQEAELKSNQILENAKSETRSIAEDVQRLTAQKQEITSKLRYLLSSQLELLNTFISDEEGFSSSKKKLTEHHFSFQHTESKSTQPNFSNNNQTAAIAIAPIIETPPIVQPEPETPIQEVKIEELKSPEPTQPNFEPIVEAQIQTELTHVELNTTSPQKVDVPNSTFEDSIRAAMNKNSFDEIGTNGDLNATKNFMQELKSEIKYREPEISASAKSTLIVQETHAVHETEKFNPIHENKDKTVRFEVNVEGYKGSSVKKSVNIDDILDSLE